MTDIIPTAPISIRRSSLPRLSLSKIDIGASLYAIARLLGHAFDLAYVAPFSSRRRPPVILDNDIEGRDPRW
jgi:hypothetical protein